MKKIQNLWIFNTNRLRILHKLYSCKDELCGCDLVEELDIPKNLLSYHIKTLRDKKIIHAVKCGVRKNYSICKDKRRFVRRVLKIVELI